MVQRLVVVKMNEETHLGTVPVQVNNMVPVRNLQFRRYPNAIDRNVDGCDPRSDNEL